MPGVYEVAAPNSTTANTTTAAAQAIATIVTAAGQQCRVKEIGVFNVSGAASEIGVGIPAAVGAGTLTGSLAQPLDPSDVAGVTTLVWGSTNRGFGTSAPTAPSVPFRRAQLGSVAGAGIVWVWADNELVIPVSKQIVIWQFTSVICTYDVYVKLMGG